MLSKYHLKGVLRIAVVLATGVSTSAAQQPAAPQSDDLQKEVQELKQQYEQVTALARSQQ